MTTPRPPTKTDEAAPNRRKQLSSASAYYPSMLTIAGQLGCHIETGKENPTLLKGICPFHEAPTMQQSKTLQIDAKTSRFVCYYCEAEGNPVAFAAMVWGVSATDAHLLLTNHNGIVTAARPGYPPIKREDGQPPEWTWNTKLNSAVLTRASNYYQGLLYTSYPALSMLAKMGVPPELAEKAGIGYSSGTGLREHLAGTGVTIQEMEDSPIFHLINQVETFTGRITMADRDYTGATVWMTSISPETVENQGEWKERRPNTMGLPGQKPYLFGIHRIPEQAPCVHITDDPRLYILLASHGVAVTLLTQRRRRGEPVEARGEKTANRLMRKQPAKVVLAMHDRQTRTVVETTIRGQYEDKEIVLHGRPAILANLDPKTRNLEAMATESSITRPTYPSRPQNQDPEAEPEAQPEAEAQGNPEIELAAEAQAEPAPVQGPEDTGLAGSEPGQEPRSPTAEQPSSEHLQDGPVALQKDALSTTEVEQGPGEAAEHEPIGGRAES